MPSVEMKAKVDISVEGVEEAIVQMMLDNTFKPYKVVIDAPHATYVEFGTGPAQKKDGVPHIPRDITYKGVTKTYERTEVFWKMYDWVTAKLGPMLKDPLAYTSKLYVDTMENGMPPRPYVRPVLHELEREFNKVLAEKGSVEGVAEELAERIRDNLDSPRFVNSAETYEGSLRDSIHVEPVSDGEIVNGGGISEDVWASDTCDYQGQERERSWRVK